MKTREYGSSKDIKYLRGQINALGNYINAEAYKMSSARLLEEYRKLDMLNTRLGFLTGEVTEDDIREYNARLNGQF